MARPVLCQWVHRCGLAWQAAAQRSTLGVSRKRGGLSQPRSPGPDLSSEKNGRRCIDAEAIAPTHASFLRQRRRRTRDALSTPIPINRKLIDAGIGTGATAGFDKNRGSLAVIFNPEVVAKFRYPVDAKSALEDPVSLSLLPAAA